ncbi:hypothetical protein L210DRAFT_3060336 [Boletus edulis BED1]|uniref:Uncharacterized protein n=1 Tax=Boletus edulis BED1 TaxID=1328754 RepID=A0AAD4C1E8_BOLED|nr:hypothetical protein L210DRAFT_3060336 [Boletus edulis BED1]
MTLLKLCETPIIRTQLHEIKLLDVFVSQLQQKDNALLAAYALVTCLKYSDMKTTIEDNIDWPKHIIKMLEMDCFDDALGAVEGFRIFEDLMQDADLRKRIVESNIIHVLETKLGNGKLKENRMGLICLDIIRTCDPSHSWTDELVGIGLKHLKSSKTWEAGTMILSALSQTDHGLAAVCLRIHEIIEMLLPGGYRRIQPTPPQAIAGLTQITNHILMSLCLAATQTTLSLSTTLRDSAWPPSWVTGPVYALRILAQNETLRNHARETIQYSDLKIMYYGSGAFSGKTGKWPWQKRDMFKMLDEMFKAVEQ